LYKVVINSFIPTSTGVYMYVDNKVLLLRFWQIAQVVVN